jgi:hypothetical protein
MCRIFSSLSACSNRSNLAGNCASRSRARCFTSHQKYFKTAASRPIWRCLRLGEIAVLVVGAVQDHQRVTFGHGLAQVLDQGVEVGRGEDFAVLAQRGGRQQTSLRECLAAAQGFLECKRCLVIVAAIADKQVAVLIPGQDAWGTSLAASR